MSYLKFNKWVLDYYRSTNVRDKVCCLAIDEYEIDRFKSRYSLKNYHFPEVIDLPWSKLLLKDNHNGINVPRYFGLIALQCLAAASMENTVDISSSNYNTRFSELTGIDLKYLEEKYAEGIGMKKVQDYIWQHLKIYLKDNHGFNLDIPLEKTHKDRYIQYPKSQVVLNKEDLKEIGEIVFPHIILEAELISEPRFIEMFKKEYSRQNLHRKNNQIKHNSYPICIFFKQIFNYFNSGDWQKHIPKEKRLSHDQYKPKYVIEFDIDDNINFYIGYEKIVNPHRIFRDRQFYFFTKLFEMDEFEQSNSFLLNEEVIIVSTSSMIFGDVIPNNYVGINIVKCSFNSEIEVPLPILGYLKRTNDKVPVFLKGIRIGHVRSYIENCGPEIIGGDYIVLFSSYEDPFNLLFLKNYDPMDCSPGIYTIRMPGFTNLDFRIVESEAIEVKEEMIVGLELRSFHMVTEGVLLKGLNLEGNKLDKEEVLTVNSWVKANLDPYCRIKQKLLKSINYFQNERQ